MYAPDGLLCPPFLAVLSFKVPTGSLMDSVSLHVPECVCKRSQLSYSAFSQPCGRVTLRTTGERQACGFAVGRGAWGTWEHGGGGPGPAGSALVGQPLQGHVHPSGVGAPPPNASSYLCCRQGDRSQRGGQEGEGFER